MSSDLSARQRLDEPVQNERMIPPTLYTERLELVPVNIDCDDLYQVFYTDAEASRHYGGPLSPQGAWARLAFDVGVWTLQGFGVWAVRIKAGRQLAGVCGYWQGRGWPRELTWWLLPEHRGRGLAFEASCAALEHAYGVWGWEKVETSTRDSNAPAQALVSRLGGLKVDRRQFPDGEERYVYFLPRPEVTGVAGQCPAQARING